MIKNYFKLAWRQLRNNKLFGWVNISGLAIGLTVSLLLLLHIALENSFDTYHSNAQHIYRLLLDATEDGKKEIWASSPNIAGPTFRQEISDVAAQTRWIKHQFGESANIRYNGKKFFEQNLFWADSSLTSIFDIPFVQGNPATALVRPNSIIISETTAKKYFGTETPLGKILHIDNTLLCEVTGVYKDFPPNSTLDADFIGSFYTVGWMNKNMVWSNASFETYLLLNPGADYRKVEKAMADIVNSRLAKENRWFSFELQPLKNVHLYSSGISNSYTSHIGDLKQVRIVSILALVILLIACINYMNLATAKSQNRFREVGINKTLGATGGMLITRFYAETAMFVLLSVAVSFLLLIPSIFLFNHLTGEQLTLSGIFTPSILTILLVVMAIITLVAGSYPALYLSSFNPKNLFHQTFHKKSLAGKLRQSLVVLQFAASVVLIVAAFLFYRQLQFIQNKKLGYRPEQVVAITTSAVETKEQIDGLINDTKNLPAAKDVCRSQTYPGRAGSGRGLRRIDAIDNNQQSSLTTCRATPEILDVLDIKLLAGATLPAVKAKGDTTVQVVLTKKAADYLGYTPEEAIGKKVFAQLGPNTYIVGVTEDFHSKDLHKPVEAYAFHNAATENRSFMLVKLATNHLKSSLDQLEKVYHKNVPNGAFEYTFLDQYLRQLYAGEQRTARIVLFFSALAIFIACLGLFGLAAFMAEQRIKEIGIRKILGASVFHLTALLSGNFLQLVLLSVIIATPVAWWLMHRWLLDFAYRITISWWVFPAAGLVVLLVALATVSLQAAKAAMANPVKSLRME